MLLVLLRISLKSLQPSEAFFNLDQRAMGPYGLAAHLNGNAVINAGSTIPCVIPAAALVTRR